MPSARSTPAGNWRMPSPAHEVKSSSLLKASERLTENCWKSTPLVPQPKRPVSAASSRPAWKRRMTERGVLPCGTVGMLAVTLAPPNSVKWKALPPSQSASAFPAVTSAEGVPMCPLSERFGTEPPPRGRHSQRTSGLALKRAVRARAPAAMKRESSSGSESLARTSMVTGRPWRVLAVSSTATGGLLRLGSASSIGGAHEGGNSADNRAKREFSLALRHASTGNPMC